MTFLVVGNVSDEGCRPPGVLCFPTSNVKSTYNYYIHKQEARTSIGNNKSRLSPTEWKRGLNCGRLFAWRWLAATEDCFTLS